MGTTDPSQALVALEVLRESGVPHAMLHGRERLLRGEAVSDVDLVISTPPDEVVSATKAAFISRGLYPIVVCAYDVRETRSVWYAVEDGTEGVQLDLMHDVEGFGRLGVRSGALLDNAYWELYPPIISEPAQLVYLWRKRAWKRQHHQLQKLRRCARLVPRDKLEQASRSVTGSVRTARELWGARPLPTWMQLTLHPVLHTMRGLGRVRRPAGYWIHAPSAELALDIAAAFARLLPHSAVGKTPRSTLACELWFWRSVQPIRLRPGVYVSFGEISHQRRPDLVIHQHASPREARMIAVAMMSRRY